MIEVQTWTSTELRQRRDELEKELLETTVEEVRARYAEWCVSAREEQILRELDGINYLLGDDDAES